MPDISMCQDDLCPSRSDCYRHRGSGTKASLPYQWYADFDRKGNLLCWAFTPTVQVIPPMPEGGQAQGSAPCDHSWRITPSWNEHIYACRKCGREERRK